MKKFSTLVFVFFYGMLSSKAAITFYSISATATVDAATISFSISNSTSPFNTPTKILYGTSASAFTDIVGPSTFIGSTVTTSMSLTGLLSNTTYFYQLKSGTTTSAILNFTTTSPLPTTITQFTATKKENTAQLNWISENELNVAHFNIQRSINGKDFEIIGKVNAGKNEYNFSDKNLPISVTGNTIYYRLQVVDKDGSNTYSTIKQITLNNKQGAVNIFPTLATSQVNIEYATTKNETINIKIVDITGKLIDAKNVNATAGNNNFYYDCSKLHTGNYFMIFSNKNELMKTKQFSKF